MAIFYVKHNAELASQKTSLAKTNCQTMLMPSATQPEINKTIKKCAERPPSKIQAFRCSQGPVSKTQHEVLAALSTLAPPSPTAASGPSIREPWATLSKRLTASNAAAPVDPSVPLFIYPWVWVSLSWHRVSVKFKRCTHHLDKNTHCCYSTFGPGWLSLQNTSAFLIVRNLL